MLKQKRLASNQFSSLTVLAIAVIFILAGIFIAILTAMGAFDSFDFGFLSRFNTYIFGVAIALKLQIVGGLLLFLGLHGS